MNRFTKCITICASIIAFLPFCACGKKEELVDYTEYKQSMEAFFTKVEGFDETVNNIDADDDKSVENLYSALDSLELAYKELSDVDAPPKYDLTEGLADEAYTYMVQANEYFHKSFSDSSFNEYTLNAAMECYQRVNKRTKMMIDILHDRTPSDYD